MMSTGSATSVKVLTTGEADSCLIILAAGFEVLTAGFEV